MGRAVIIVKYEIDTEPVHFEADEEEAAHDISYFDDASPTGFSEYGVEAFGMEAYPDIRLIECVESSVEIE